MRQVLDVNILDDPAVQKMVARWSLPCAVAALGLVAFSVTVKILDTSVGDALVWALWLALLYVVSLPLHELVHALFFKAFGPAGAKVTFGFKSGMLYAGCPGTFLRPAQFMVVLLAPFAVLTALYGVVGFAWNAPLLAWCLFFLHTSGCAGDFYFAWVIRRHPEADLCEDTPTGIALWRKDD